MGKCQAPRYLVLDPVAGLPVPLLPELKPLPEPEAEPVVSFLVAVPPLLFDALELSLRLPRA
jgi:hypothetical protein